MQCITCPIEEILEDARNGQPYILVGAEGGENEGVVIIPAQFATPEQINFMAKHARGLICLCITARRAGQLRLPRMAGQNQAGRDEAFTISIEAAEGVTTGISAHDRAHTIAVAIDPTKGPNGIVSPCHVFPLVAKDGGALVRAGHIEAAVDISRVSGLVPRRGDLPDHEGRVDGAPTRPGRLRPVAPVEDRRHRRPDRLPPPYRAAGGAGARDSWSAPRRCSFPAPAASAEVGSPRWRPALDAAQRKVAGSSTLAGGQLGCLPAEATTAPRRSSLLVPSRRLGRCGNAEIACVAASHVFVRVVGLECPYPADSSGQTQQLGRWGRRERCHSKFENCLTRLGAEVKGLDLRRPLDAATVGALHMARAERLVLVFPRQSVSPTEHVCFAGYLGEAIDFPDGSLAIQTTRRSSSCRPYNDFIENRVLHRVTLKGPEIARSAEAAARELEMEAHA